MISFHLGKKETTVTDYIIIGVVLSIVVPFLTKMFGVKESTVLLLIDEIQREFFPQSKLNDFIIRDDELLTIRVKNDVDVAIEEYKTLTDFGSGVIMNGGVYSEKPSDGSTAQNLLGGEMAITSPWVSD